MPDHLVQKPDDENDEKDKECLPIDFAEAWAILSIGVSVIVIAVCIFLCINILKLDIIGAISKMM